MMSMGRLMLKGAFRRVTIRVRNELCAAAVGAEVEIAAVACGSMRGVLRHLHPADDIDRFVRTGQSMSMMRLRGAVVSVRGAAVPGLRVMMFVSHSRSSSPSAFKMGQVARTLLANGIDPSARKRAQSIVAFATPLR
jgi:hypothetical protein